MKLNFAYKIDAVAAETMSEATPVKRSFTLGQTTLEVIPDLDGFAARVLEFPESTMTYIASNVPYETALSSLLAYLEAKGL